LGLGLHVVFVISVLGASSAGTDDRVAPWKVCDRRSGVVGSPWARKHDSIACRASVRGLDLPPAARMRVTSASSVYVDLVQASGLGDAVVLRLAKGIAAIAGSRTSW
jgi:hypothetical protein